MMKEEEADSPQLFASEPLASLSDPSNPLGQKLSSTSKKSRFMITARSDEEIHAASRRIPQESRPTKPVALAKLRSRATIGIDPPFTFLDLDNTDLTLQHTYNVSMRI